MSFPENYIAFVVNKGIDIVADAGQASIYSTVAAGGAGIAVDVSGDQVVRIRGFLINSADGIVINGSGVVHIEDGTLMGVAGRYGIVYSPTGAGELNVSNTRVTRPTVPPNLGGILIRPTGSGSAKVVLDNVSLKDNTSGVLIDGRTTTGSNSVTIRNSTVSGSTGFGIQSVDSGSGATNTAIEGSTVANNGTSGIVSNGANVTTRVRNSTITGNGIGLNKLAAAKLISHGGNVVAGNGTNGTFTATAAQQ